jgi:hypothetical protein
VINNERRIVREVKTVKVIKVTYLAGSGTTEDTYRLVDQYWSTDGKLLAVNDIAKGDPDEAV